MAQQRPDDSTDMETAEFPSPTNTTPKPRSDVEHCIDTYTHLESIIIHPETKELLVLTSSLTGDYSGGKIFLLKSIYSPVTTQQIIDSPINLKSFIRYNTQRTVGGNTAGCWISSNEFVASTERGTVEIWQKIFASDKYSVESGAWSDLAFEAVSVMYGHNNIVSSVRCWPTDAENLVTSSHDGSCRIWSMKSYMSTDCYRAHLGPVHALECQTDGNNLFVTGATDRSVLVRLWDRREKLSVGRVLGLQDYFSVRSLSWGVHNPSTLAIGTETGHLVLHDFRSMNSDVHLLSIQPHDDVIRELSFCPQHQSLLATASHDNTARVLSVADGEMLAGPVKHSDMVTTVEWYPQSKLLLSAAVNCEIMYTLAQCEK
ncbi:hypothetical protein LOD99_388 [Oopsacas minuta]|uniref:Anaphase-promoting complex subunit 4-like WD40 domain-containing protein n=1 Tax=Oopsacas minuta TaxID=111878 RepID=A0AAV7K9Y8_9METZ|nr:hypothetical protein LOD99_388 [Oopsacas minuta]